eukprot:360813-Chlamydomonas_euryale.AAC.2
MQPGGWRSSRPGRLEVAAAAGQAAWRVEEQQAMQLKFLTCLHQSKPEPYLNWGLNKPEYT